MITEDRLIEICTPDFPDITFAEIEQILNHQRIVEKLKEKLLYYQNRGWETEVSYTELLQSIYFVNSKKGD